MLSTTAEILFIADTYNTRIRRVDAATGIITTFAGGGLNNPGDGGPATAARIGFTVGAVADAAGNLYFSDYDNHRVRRVDAATGIITTVAGTGICGFTGNGGPAISARICGPTHLALDRAAGILYMAELSNNTVRRINLGTGIINLLTGYPRNSGLALDASAGFLYISVLTAGQVYRYNLATGVTSVVASGFELDLDPTGGGLALDGAGHLFVAEPWDNNVLRITLSNGQVTTVAGNGSDFDSEDGWLASQTWLNFPGSVFPDASGNLFISEFERIRRVDANTQLVSTLLAIPLGGGAPAPAPGGVLFGDPGGDLYIGDYSSSRILRRSTGTGALSLVAGNGDYDFSGDGGPATAAALTYVSGGVLDAAGNIYFADGENYRVRRIDHATGIITTVAGNGDYQYSGDGGPATSAGMDPWDVALDGAGNLYLADGSNNRIRKVDALTGIISTVAGTGVSGTGGDGGPATAAQLRSPGSILVDAAGNITISGSDRIRRVDVASGIIDTIAGTGLCCFAGDGGPAVDARFDDAGDLHEDASGNFYVVDSFNFRIRKVTFQAANGAPEARAGADFAARCASASGAAVTLDGSASSDPDSGAGTNDDIASFEWFENYGGAEQTLLGTGEILDATLALGSHLITLRVTDHAGLSDTDEIEVTVQDTTPPDFSLSVTPEILSPPNQQFVPIHAAVGASDACGPVSIVLVGVTSNESNLPGDVVPPADIRNANYGTADFDFELRAKRLGSGSGRTYTITYQVTDGSGNETLASDTVSVLHNRRVRTPDAEKGTAKPKRPVAR